MKQFIVYFFMGWGIADFFRVNRVACIMKYSYACDTCTKEITITKTMSEASNTEHCECGKELRRIYTPSGIKTGDGVKGAR